MIISDMFPGDGWHELKWAQHDAYGKAIGILYGACRRAYQSSLLIVGREPDEIMERLSRKRGVDHRVLQFSHDHLAAWWRMVNNHTQPTLGFEGGLDDLVGTWLTTLDREVSSWQETKPSLVRNICIAVAFENEEPGYSAEGILKCEIERLYSLQRAQQRDDPKC